MECYQEIYYSFILLLRVNFGIKFEERNVIDERFDYLCNMVDAIQEKLKKIRTEINTYE